MTKSEAIDFIDNKITEYKKDLNSPLAEGYEQQINGIISGLKEARKLIKKITKI